MRDKVAIENKHLKRKSQVCIATHHALESTQWFTKDKFYKNLGKKSSKLRTTITISSQVSLMKPQRLEFQINLTHNIPSDCLSKRKLSNTSPSDRQTKTCAKSLWQIFVMTPDRNYSIKVKAKSRTKKNHFRNMFPNVINSWLLGTYAHSHTHQHTQLYTLLSALTGTSIR